MKSFIRQIICFISLLVFAHFSTAQDSTERLGDIVISGSRSSQRTAVSTPTPVDIFSEEDIKDTGITRTDKLLENLVPSMQLPKPTISDGSDSLYPIVLRKLGTDHVLVLINGKRRHKSALLHFNDTIGRGSNSTDLAAIPVSAIKKIEVLRDGASAVYGSDAIAGVVNIVLKGSSSQNSLSANTGIYQVGDGAKLEGLFNYTTPLSKKYTVTWLGKASVAGRTDRSGEDFRCNYVNNNTIPCPSQDARELAFDRDNFWYGNNEVSNFHLWYNLENNNKGSKGLYSFGGTSYRNSLGPGYYRQAKSNRNHPEIYPDGFLPKIRTQIVDISSVVGNKFQKNGWASDVSMNFGYNSFNFGVENSLNASYGPKSPTSADSGTLSELLLAVNADFTKQLGRLFKSPLFWAFGAEARLENYAIKEGDELSYANGGKRDQYGDIAIPGIQVFPGASPENALSKSRINLGTYTEVSSQFDKLFVQAAARGEYYSDFGLSLTQKLAGHYQVNKSLGFRSSLSTGFRAPSLSQKYANSTSTFVQGNVLTQVGTFNTDSELAKTIGLPQLEEETSYSASAGLVLSQGRKRKTTIDAYYTVVNDRVLLSRSYDKSDFGNLLNGPKYQDIAKLQFFTNGYDLATRGIDIVHAGYTNIKRGVLTYSAAFNWGATEILESRDPDSLQTDVKTLSRSTRFSIESANPDTVLRLSGAYKLKDWKVSLSTNRYGEYTTTDDGDGDDADTQDQTFSAKWVTDVRLTKSIKRGKYSVSVGVNNLFDVYPDKNDEGKNSGFGGIFPYNTVTTPFEFNGRFFAVDVTYNF